MSEMVAVWSAEQQRLLHALGFQVLQPVQEAAGQACLSDVADGAAQVPVANVQLMRPRFSLISFPPSAESAQQQMLLAVSRAAGLSLDGVQLVQAGAGDAEMDLPSLEVLLSSATARRALWPRLRKLKRDLRGPAPG
ncbi:MAG: hypothetical protein ACT4NL_00205 [Pseudomarimonas sp.]